MTRTDPDKNPILPPITSVVDMSDIEVHGTVDARGMVCTKPLMEVRKVIKPMESGQVVEVLCEPDISPSIQRVFVQVQKNELLSVEDAGDHIRILLRKA